MDKIFLICGGIVLTGLIVFLFLVFKARKKHKAIKHYEKIRDSLTLREQKKIEKELDYERYSGLDLGNIAGAFIVVLVGVILLPIVKEEIATASSSANITGSTETMLGLVTIFFVLAIIASAIGLIASGLRSSGLI